MFRTARRITPLLHSILFGAAAASGLMLATGSLAGCADENEPSTHVKKLSDPATRQQAVTRLIQFFEDAMTRDKDNREGPTVKPLLDEIMVPLNETCLNGDLDDKTNAKLVKFVSYTRDARGVDCLLKALKDFKPEKKETEEPVRWAARAIGPMKLKAASAPLIDVFGKLRVSKLKQEPELYRDVHDAMLEIADQAWEGALIEKLNHPINDRKDVSNLKDEIVWQTTAAELLGVLKSANAVKPLIKTVLSPNKADIASTSVNALIKIGKPSVAPAVALLRSDDKELVEYSKGENLKANAGPDGKVPEAATKAAEKAHIATAAIILSSIGRDDATQALLDAVAAADKGDDLARAVIARELSKLPKTDATVKTFQSVYEKTPNGLDIPPGNGAKESLLEAAGYFFDASLVPWIVKTAVDLKGEADDIDPIRAASLQAAMKLMKADQTGDVEKLFSIKANGPDGKPTTLGKAYEKEYRLATDLLKACGDKVDCYLGKATEPASQANETQFQGYKALYMVGVLGGPEVRQKIIDTMPKLSNAALRFIGVQIIDHFSPKGDAGLAAALQKIVDEGEASKDPLRIQGNTPFKQVIYRLNARGQ
jgi:HEAT repeat protein